MPDQLFGNGAAIARIALDAATMRHETIAANIANINSEGYVPHRVTFEEHINKADLSGKVALESDRIPKPIIEPDLTAGGVPTQVALDTEILKLNTNTLKYQALTRAISRSLTVLNIAISEGRR